VASSKFREFLSSLLTHKTKFDVLQIDFIRRITTHRAFQFSVIFPNLLIFWIIIVAGLFGGPVGNRNISVIFVWILWWFALISILVPFASRIWCTICPIPFFGEWIQRRSLVTKKNEKLYGLNKRWPRRLDNIWLQNMGFLLIATFTPLLVTRPVVTGIMLALLFVVATILMLIYAKRVFCRYVCPVGGFLGLFSMFSSLELRVNDRELCKKHITKECIRGGDNGYGCPWLVYPGTLERNNFCGLCLECIKGCPYNNISLNIRPFGSDILVKGERAIDEAWKSFIMFTLAGIYILVMQGPFIFFKDLARFFWVPPYGWGFTYVTNYVMYAGLVWITSLAIVPAIFFVFTALSKLLSGSKEISYKKLFIDYSYELIPLSLMAWIAFSVPLLLVNWSYIANVISDPLGWGWNLFGTAEIAWKPLFPEYIPYIQVVLLIIGLVYSIKFGFEISMENFRDKSLALKAFIPQLAFMILASIFFLWLFVG